MSPVDTAKSSYWAQERRFMERDVLCARGLSVITVSKTKCVVPSPLRIDLETTDSFAFSVQNVPKHMFSLHRSNEVLNSK